MKNQSTKSNPSPTSTPIPIAMYFAFVLEDAEFFEFFTGTVGGIDDLVLEGTKDNVVDICIEFDVWV